MSLGIDGETRIYLVRKNKPTPSSIDDFLDISKFVTRLDVEITLSALKFLTADIVGSANTTSPRGSGTLYTELSEGNFVYVMAGLKLVVKAIIVNSNFEKEGKITIDALQSSGLKQGVTLEATHWRGGDFGTSQLGTVLWSDSSTQSYGILIDDAGDPILNRTSDSDWGTEKIEYNNEGDRISCLDAAMDAANKEWEILHGYNDATSPYSEGDHIKYLDVLGSYDSSVYDLYLSGESRNCIPQQTNSKDNTVTNAVTVHGYDKYGTLISTNMGNFTDSSMSTVDTQLDTILDEELDIDAEYIEVAHDMTTSLTNGQWYHLKIDDEFIIGNWITTENRFEILYRGVSKDPWWDGQTLTVNKHLAGTPILILSEIGANWSYGNDNVYGHSWVREIVLDNYSFVSIGDYLNIGQEKVKVIDKYSTDNKLRIIRHHEVTITEVTPATEPPTYEIDEEIPFTDLFYAHTSPNMRCWDSQYNFNNPEPLPDTNSIANNGFFYKTFKIKTRGSLDQLDKYAIKILNALDNNIDGYLISLSKAPVKYNSINVGDLVSVYDGEFLNISDDEYRVYSMTYRFPTQMLELQLTKKTTRSYAAKSKLFTHQLSESNSAELAEKFFFPANPFDSFFEHNRQYAENILGKAKVGNNFANSIDAWLDAGGDSSDYVLKDSDNEPATVGYVKAYSGGTGQGGLWTDDDVNLTPFDSRNILPSAATDNIGLPGTPWNDVYLDDLKFPTNEDGSSWSGISVSDSTGNLIYSNDSGETWKSLETDPLWNDLGDALTPYADSRNVIPADPSDTLGTSVFRWGGLYSLNIQAYDSAQIGWGGTRYNLLIGDDSFKIQNSFVTFPYENDYPWIIFSQVSDGSSWSAIGLRDGQVKYTDNSGATWDTVGGDESLWEIIGGGVIRPKDDYVINVGQSISGPSSTQVGDLWYNQLYDELNVRTSSGIINLLSDPDVFWEESGSSLRPENSAISIIANGSGSDLGAPYSGEAWENLYLTDSIYLTNNYITSSSDGNNLYFYGNDGANRLLRLEPTNGAVVGRLTMTDSVGTITGYIDDWRLYRGSSQKIYVSSGDIYYYSDIDMEDNIIKGIDYLSFEPTAVTYKYLMTFDPSGVSGNCGLMYTNSGDLRVIGNGAQIISVDLNTKETDFYGDLDINDYDIKEVTSITFADGTTQSTAASGTISQISYGTNVVDTNGWYVDESGVSHYGIVAYTSATGNDIVLAPRDDVIIANRYNTMKVEGDIFMSFGQLQMNNHYITGVDRLYFEDGTYIDTAPDTDVTDRIENGDNYADVGYNGDEVRIVSYDGDMLIYSDYDFQLNVYDDIEIIAGDYIELKWEDNDNSAYLMFHDDFYYGRCIEPHSNTEVLLGTDDYNFYELHACKVYGDTYNDTCDLSELQFVSEDVEPGDIVEIGDWEGWEKEFFDEQVAKCKEENCLSPKYLGLQGTWKKAAKRSTKCPSIVSTKPGTAMGTGKERRKLHEEGKMNFIALSGSIPMVYIEGKFESGDILVSAGNGHAMVDNNAKWNEVVGYAKRSGKDERCEVWVR